MAIKKTGRSGKPVMKRDSPAESPQTTVVDDSAQAFPIVGIGASAGGLQALTQFLDALPENPGVALVIIQHLDPTRKSLGPELLASHTSMKLCEVSDSPRVLPNSVYVIPPGKYLSISQGELHLSEPDRPRGSRMAIDFFLRSLASDVQHRSVGIIMSGAGTDGTLGIKQIKESGGMVMVQDPATADHTGMPRSAIDTGVADFVLPPNKIAEALVNYAVHPYVKQPDPDLSLEGSEVRAAHSPEAEAFKTILALLRVRSRHDFRNYKPQTLLRRTRRRMSLARFSEYDDYLKLLRDHPEEIDRLVKDLLISVTNFFRDEEAWEIIRKEVVIPIVAQASSDSAIRVWSCGCATGEEPYSLAMLFLEELSNAKKTSPLQIFASDIDKDALNLARQGVYPSSIRADVSPERLKRFFVRGDNEERYRVAKQVRESVVFAEQNLIPDPPFSKLDLICCRNLLIYLRPEVQERLISLFHFSIREGGFLFLGSAETLGRQADSFAPLNKRWRVFRRNGVARPDRVALATDGQSPRREIGIQPHAVLDSREPRLPNLANRWIVEWLAPNAVLVDAKWNILYIHGNVDKFLQHPTGVPREDLLDKARRGLRVKLREAVHRAINEDQVVIASAHTQFNDQYLEVQIAVRPFHDTINDRTLALVLFQDVTGAQPVSELSASAISKPISPPADGEPQRAHRLSVADADLDDHKVIKQLEQELTATKDELQASVEQFEASNEELKAANEEVMSINEELQSTNEELETSKEELQSLNEELTTVNNQLAVKVDELEAQHADLKNLVGATDVATVCLDRENKIRWFTPAATRVFRLQESDTGRPLSDFAHDFLNDHLAAVTRRVLETLIPSEDEVSCDDGRTFLRRIFPYRTEDDHIIGVIITYVDITRRKKSELALAESERQLRQLAKSLEQQVEHRVSVLKVLHDITMAANEAQSFDEAIKAALERICHFNGWVVGHAWQLTDDGDLTSSKVWQYVRESKSGASPFDALRDASERIRLSIEDKFIGDVIRTGLPKWITNIDTFENRSTAHPANFGLRSAVAFPVLFRNESVAVLEFFGDKPFEPDERFLEIMPQVGIQLGHVYERKRLEREVAMVADKEHQRMAQEMHDGLGQQIAGIAMLTGSLADSLKADHNPNAVKALRVLSAIEDAKQQSRRISKGLMPVEIDADGLLPAIDDLAAETERTYGIQCRLEAGQTPLDVDAFTATHLFRIAREAVHNAVKHAKANRIWIELSSAANSISLLVRDDGAGLSAHHNDGVGLRIMRHRVGLIGGTLDIRSADEGGTIITCSIGRKAYGSRPELFQTELE